jgi:thioesterase domain-containing protein/acyl carrier protein
MLQKNLLEYMVPSFFVKMEKFLLTPNGKIDRKELPYPNIHNCFRNSKYEEPRNDLQKKLVAIWSKVLKIDMISINDSFSNLGGDSLALLEVHYYIEEEIGSKFPIYELAKSNTIIELSEAIERNKDANKKIPFIQIQREGKGKTPIVFISPVYGDASLLAVNLMKKTNEDHAFLATLDFKTDSDYFPKSVEECAKIYMQELELLYPSNEYILGGYSMGGLVALEMISILKGKGKIAKGLFLVDTSHPTMLEIINNASASKKIKFYLNTFIKSNPKIRKNLALIITNYLLKKIKSCFKEKDFTIVQNEAQKEIQIKSISNMDRLKSISLKYIPKKFDGKTILFSANDETDLVSEFIKDNNITVWGNHMSSKLISYDILTTHRLIMTNPHLEQVANIINEELLNQNS